MGIKPKDIGAIELYATDSYGSKYCFGRFMLDIAKDSHMEDPDFEKITLTKIHCRGNEVTFRVGMQNKEESGI